MRKTLCALVAVMFLVLVATPPKAEVPAVTADIAPVQSLVARVMRGTEAPLPVLIVPQDGSPHGHALRPSQAAGVQRADLVVWMGPGLTPWLEGALDSLAPAAARLELLAVKGTRLLPWRESEGFEAHDHEEHHDDDHGHENHGHDDHGDDDHGDDEHGHAGDGMDPHAWLDPVNAALWLDAIAGALAAIDPENAALYRDNAAQGQAELAALQAEIEVALGPLKGLRFVVSHDAFHYFEARFDLHAQASVAEGDAAPAGAARLSGLRGQIADTDIACVLIEPQVDETRLRRVLGEDLRFGRIDPLGSDLEQGAGLYPALLRGLAGSLVACATP